MLSNLFTKVSAATPMNGFVQHSPTTQETNTCNNSTTSSSSTSTTTYRSSTAYNYPNSQIMRVSTFNNDNSNNDNSNNDNSNNDNSNNNNNNIVLQRIAQLEDQQSLSSTKVQITNKLLDEQHTLIQQQNETIQNMEQSLEDKIQGLKESIDALHQFIKMKHDVVVSPQENDRDESSPTTRNHNDATMNHNQETTEIESSTINTTLDDFPSTQLDATSQEQQQQQQKQQSVVNHIVPLSQEDEKKKQHLVTHLTKNNVVSSQNYNVNVQGLTSSNEKKEKATTHAVDLNGVVKSSESSSSEINATIQSTSIQSRMKELINKNAIEVEHEEVHDNEESAGCDGRNDEDAKKKPDSLINNEGEQSKKNIHTATSSTSSILQEIDLDAFEQDVEDTNNVTKKINQGDDCSTSRTEMVQEDVANQISSTTTQSSRKRLHSQDQSFVAASALQNHHKQADIPDDEGTINLYGRSRKRLKKTTDSFLDGVADGHVLIRAFGQELVCQLRSKLNQSRPKNNFNQLGVKHTQTTVTSGGENENVVNNNSNAFQGEDKKETIVSKNINMTQTDEDDQINTLEPGQDREPKQSPPVPNYNSFPKNNSITSSKSPIHQYDSLLDDSSDDDSQDSASKDDDDTVEKSYNQENFQVKDNFEEDNSQDDSEGDDSSYEEEKSRKTHTTARKKIMFSKALAKQKHNNENLCKQHRRIKSKLPSAMSSRRLTRSATKPATKPTKGEVITLDSDSSL